MIRRLRYALTVVGDIAKVLCPASDYVHTRVDAARDADALAEREAAVEVWEGYKFGPADMCAAGTSPGVVSAHPPGLPRQTDAPTPGQPEPTEELLLAAANQLDEWRSHTHFNHPREEYLCGLVRQLRDRATLFAQYK